MKIKDVIISEAKPVNKGTAAGYKGTAGAQAIAQASGIKDVNKIRAGQVIKIPNGQGGTTDYTVQAGDTLDKIAAANKVSAAAPAAAPAAPAADAPAAIPAKSDGTTQDIERLKKLAIGGDTTQDAPAQDAMAGADAGDQTSSGYTAQSQAQKSPDPEPDAPVASDTPVNNQSSGYSAQSQAQKSPEVQQASSGYTGGTSAAQNPGGYAQSAVPDTSGQAARPDAQVSPDTGLSTVAPQVQSGTPGVNWNIKTGSDDEMAWRSKNPNWNMTGKQYPGPGNWDPKTGRSKAEIAQGEKNAAAVKGFLNKINPFAKKEQPTAPDAATAGQAGQPVKGPQTPGGYGRFNEETRNLRKLAGLE